jgi:hypothetical protein
LSWQAASANGLMSFQLFLALAKAATKSWTSLVVLNGGGGSRGGTRQNSWLDRLADRRELSEKGLRYISYLIVASHGVILTCTFDSEHTSSVPYELETGCMYISLLGSIYVAAVT